MIDHRRGGSSRTRVTSTLRARSGYAGRCFHGFLRGLCRVEECPAFDGHRTEPKYTPVPCQSCAGPMFGGMGGKFHALSERVCGRCTERVRAERKRREAQEAWLCVPRAWLP